MRRDLASILLLAAVVAVATLVLGWPAPAVVGALAAPRVSARGAALGAALGWGALLLWSIVRAGTSAVVGLLGGLVGAHGLAAVAVSCLVALCTLALAAGLAWAAATCVRGLLDALGIGPSSRARAASAPGCVSLSGTFDVASARDPERAPAAQTP